MMPIGVVNDR